MDNRIAEERERLFWSQDTFAAYLGVSRTRVAAWERGDSRIPSTYTLKMSQCFGCSIDYLFKLTDERTEPGKR